MNTSDTQNTDSTSRPFGYWLKAVDRLMAAEFASSFDSEHADRRDWRLLNVVDGSAPARRPLTAHKLHGLVDRGWVVAEGDGWTLTDEGRAAKERLSRIVDGIRAKVTDAVSPDDLDTTLRSLEQIARAFGWDEETPLPRRRGRRHGFGPGFGPAFGPGFGGRGFGRRHGRPFGRMHGFGPGHDAGFDAEHGGPDAPFPAAHGCEHRDHDGHGRSGHAHSHHGHPRGERHGDHRVARAAQHAYERGFDAGFSRGRDA